MKIILIIVGLVVIGAGGYFYYQSTQQPTEEGSTMEEGDAVMEEEGDSMMEEGHVISYTDSGYSPKELTVKQGETVVFKNESSHTMWPATAVHPSHTVYPGSDIQKCFDGSSDTSVLFDSCGEVTAGGEYSFTFNEVGTWRYHDHRRPSDTGTVVVQ